MSAIIVIMIFVQVILEISRRSDIEEIDRSIKEQIEINKNQIKINNSAKESINNLMEVIKILGEGKNVR